MQRFNCTVNLYNGMNFRIPKKNITVAEAQILMTIHGADCLHDIQPIKNDRTPAAKEVARLNEVYGDETVAHIFPGPVPRLPVQFADIGLVRRTGGKGIVHMSHAEADPNATDDHGEADEEAPTKDAQSRDEDATEETAAA